MTENQDRQDIYLRPGTPVRNDGCVNENWETTPEYGVVVHCWFEDEIRVYDCYVAFFGHTPPTAGKPPYIPYIVRIPSQQLKVLGSNAD